MKTLDQWGLFHGTDKASDGHNYLQFYERFLAPLKDQEIVLVEAGVGGYQYPDRGGESLRTWRSYFPWAAITGFDVYDKSGVQIPRVDILKIDQTDQETLTNLFGPDPCIDVFIDDASHVNPLSIRTFNIMFPLVKPGGIYIWEDIHTSYWPGEYEGYEDPDLSNYLLRKPVECATAVSYLQSLQHGLQADTLKEEYRGIWAGHIEEMHFMRNTCVIIKRKQP